MTRDEMQALLRRRPFQPFRVHLDDGTVYDITNPKRTLAGGTWFVVGIPDPKEPDPDISEHFEHVEWDEIVRIEPLTPSTAI
jgi:hypothetical protein